MAEPTPEQVTAALGRMVLADLAPQELQTFEAASTTYFRYGEPPRPKVAKDASLAMGMLQTVSYLTPWVLAIANEVVIQFFSDRLQSATMRRGRGLVSRFRAGSATASPSNAIRPEQLHEIRRVALEKARELQLPPGQAALLADSIVGSLALIAVDSND